MHEPLRMQTVCCRDEFGVNKTLGFTLFDVNRVSVSQFADF